ncbi:periplasmic heavy metal sensor [Sandaracinobacteroides saxicola]|uniref:Periplasmic heavy metal sensor n=1 Tax=Sandaracinobacteroides saxicola TaxID=2759707 RepID=A0A7G5IJV7_9SPHN|nr:periplasmic heavy metal sensor [Sandaracinobacteroides saxicola]QMW23649.1 periplasmic heavy metal sensor [Sandaracinobacteroides saxicola]
MKHALILLSAALIAAPALAQTPPPPPPPGAPAAAVPDMPPREGRMGREGRMFGSVSPEGRTILWAAMRPADARGDRAAIKAARDRVSDILSADRLDVPALRRAMDEERKLVDAMQAKRQAAMLDAFQKLTPADRKAFVADARQGRDRLEMGMKRWRERRTDPATGAPPPAL